MYWYFFFSPTLFPWPLNSLLPPLFYSLVLFLQHNSLKTVIFAFFCFFLTSLTSFFFLSDFSQVFWALLAFPTVWLNSCYWYHWVSELWKQLFRSWFYLWFPFSMGLEVLMIRTGEMIYETNLDVLKKTNVAQTCCRDNMDRSSLNRNRTKKQVANKDGMNY